MLDFFKAVLGQLATPYTLILVLKDPALSRSAKIRSASMLILMFGYILSPLDIIPDVIPFSGWIDDIISIPLFMLLAKQIVPEVKLAERHKAAEKNVQSVVWKIIGGVSAILLIILLWIVLLIWGIIKLIQG